MQLNRRYFRSNPATEKGNTPDNPAAISTALEDRRTESNHGGLASPPYVANGLVQVFRRNNPATRPRVSFVLVDASTRESVHTVDYLADQSVPREMYEIIWIEYFTRRHPELQLRLDRAETDGQPSPVDTWLALEMPAETEVHKHLGYNIGLQISQGELVCFCRSDVMLRPGFVRSNLDAFDADPNIVLHHDQITNNSERFYPFRYPEFGDVAGIGCENSLNGKTVGLWDDADPLSARDYNAAMTARREDLLAVGGADMAKDYLARNGGPAELSFRLTNHGCREVWCQTEMVYHTRHPRDGVADSYDGLPSPSYPNTALVARSEKRIQPLVSHPVIETGDSLATTIPPVWLGEWRIDQTNKKQQTPSASKPQSTTPGPFQTLRLAPMLLGMIGRQFGIKQRKTTLAAPYPTTNIGQSSAQKMFDLPREAFRKFKAACRFLPAAMKYNVHLVRLCWRHLIFLKSQQVQEFVLAGDGVAAEVIHKLASIMGLRVRTVVSRFDRSDDELASWNGVVLVAELYESEEYAATLEQRGVSRDRIVRIS